MQKHAIPEMINVNVFRSAKFFSFVSVMMLLPIPEMQENIKIFTMLSNAVII